MQLENFDEAIKTLKLTLFGLHTDAETIYNAIQALESQKEIYKSKSISHEGATIYYNSKEPVTHKILFAITHIGRFATVNEIREKIIKFEPDFDLGLSTPLTVLRENERIEVLKPTGSNRTTYYGLPGWAKNGTAKQEYDWLYTEYMKA